MSIGSRVVIDRDGFAALLGALAGDGYELFGPTARDGAIVHDVIRGVGDLPRGVGDEQSPGHYRLRARSDEALFGFATPAQSFKREFLAPRVTLVQIRRSATGLAFEAPKTVSRKVALIGARACDLAAVAVQDRVLRDGPYRDADYSARREGVFVLAVHCGDPAGTCFCASMGTGPKARAGFDLGATELLDGGHRFVVEVGTDEGARVLAAITSREATREDLAAAEMVTDGAAMRMGRKLDTGGLAETLAARLEHPRWDDVAERCMGCANCTLSCPTCFCTTVEDTTDLSGDLATRERRWDSCLTAEFAYLHGGSARPSLRARYRQWVTHKLSSWHEQFGSSGCVGCGRCITWCPVGIDITEEANAITRSPHDG